jgi:hypothetical protein
MRSVASCQLAWDMTLRPGRVAACWQTSAVTAPDDLEQQPLLRRGFTLE